MESALLLGNYSFYPVQSTRAYIFSFVGGKIQPKAFRNETSVNPVYKSDPVTFPKKPERTITTCPSTYASGVFIFHGRTAGQSL